MALNGYKRKLRNAGNRERNPVIFMNAEGNNKTETLYFKDFGKDRNRIVRFASGNHTDPVHMVNELQKYMEENGYNEELGDRAFCLIDADINPGKDKQIATADKLAKKYGIQVIVSVPCFEVWFLCHYALTSKVFSSNNEVITEVERYLPEYQKNAMNMYEKTKDRLSSAQKNAAKLEDYCKRCGYTPHTTTFAPSTEVYHIADTLLC